MEQWLAFLLYTNLACLGAWAHYLKKVYVDGTLCVSYKDYLITNKKATLKALGACVAVSYGYAIAGTELLALATIGGILSGGYASDSILNKAED